MGNRRLKLRLGAGLSKFMGSTAWNEGSSLLIEILSTQFWHESFVR
jgi:hypothetical protein